MMDVNVTLQFACRSCEQGVTVMVQCQGEVLPDNERGLAAVNVPCPACGQVNHLAFDACGRIHAVRPAPSIRSFAEPSLN